jgi:hypothetical protein
MMGCPPDWSSVQHDEPAQPLNLSSFIHFLNCSSPYFEGADGADGVVVERW